jgi:hypothetical protein
MTIFMLLSLLPAGLKAQQADAGRLENAVTYLASDAMLGRGFGSPEGRRASLYVRDQFAEAGVEPFVEGYFQEFSHRTSVLNITGYNVAGIIRGSDPELKDEYIILGAHYDHVGWELQGEDTVVYNGADDNASGTASIIEAGSILAGQKEMLGRSVLLVAFDGEESGLNGSRAFVKRFIDTEDPLVPAEKVVAMFSLDMVGMYEAHGGVDLQGIELLSDHKALVAAAREQADASITKSDEKIPNRTDTAPFGAVGIPSIHVFTGLESPYHKPEDDSHLLDYQGMATVVDFMVALTHELSVAPEVAGSRQMEIIAERGPMKIFNPGITVHTGSSYHDYKNDFFKAKSVFAASAGLMLETRITQWLALQPEVVYTWSGSQVSGGILRTHAVTVPVSLLLTTPDERGMGVRSYFQLGGYYSYAFAGQENGTPLDFADEYNDTDYGMVIGVGMEIMHVRVGFVYQGSFVDFTTDTDFNRYDVRLNGSFAKLAWVF